MPRATIDDVARAAGVSVATVSRALRDLPNVAPDTRRRIRDIALELDYEPHSQAARLASGRTMTVGLVAPLFGLWYASQIVAGAESVLSARGYDLLVYAVDTPENRRRFLERAASLPGRVDGLILVDFFASPDQADRLRSVDKPAVAVGEHIAGFSSVTIDNQSGARMATDHLIGLGHRRIGLVTGPASDGYHSPVPEQRADGFRIAHAAAGLPLDPTLVVDGGFTIAGGAAAMERLLDRDDPPTAVFCLSDEMAMGAVGRAHELGLEVPESVSVIGFDDHDLAEPFGLTTIRQPVRRMGSDATSRLLAAIADPDAAVTHDVVPVTLVERRSTGRLRR